MGTLFRSTSNQSSRRRPPVVDQSFYDVTTRRAIRGSSFGGASLKLRVTYRYSHSPDGAREFVRFHCAARSVPGTVATWLSPRSGCFLPDSQFDPLHSRNGIRNHDDGLDYSGLTSNYYGDGWEEKFRDRFEKEMIGKYDTHFYVGTVHQHPANWIIVGLYYPPKSATPSLF